MRSRNMFGKIVVIVLLAMLVENASLQVIEDEWIPLSEGDNWSDNQGNSTEPPEAPQRDIVQYLNCSDLFKNSLSEDVIILSNSIIVDLDNPCIMKASVIILINNEFPGNKHAFNITGKKIVMVNNTFKGPEQNHYIVGDNVLLANNKYQGDLQIHELAGYEVTAFHNVFDGKYRVQKYAGTSILVFDNESKGSPFDVILSRNPVNLTYDLYPNDLSNYETGAFNGIKEQIEYALGKTGPETFDSTPMNATRFLQEVKFGSKIERSANAAIVQKLEGLLDNHF